MLCPIVFVWNLCGAKRFPGVICGISVYWIIRLGLEMQITLWRCSSSFLYGLVWHTNSRCCVALSGTVKKINLGGIWDLFGSVSRRLSCSPWSRRCSQRKFIRHGKSRWATARWCNVSCWLLYGTAAYLMLLCGASWWCSLRNNLSGLAFSPKSRPFSAWQSVNFYLVRIGSLCRYWVGCGVHIFGKVLIKKTTERQLLQWFYFFRNKMVKKIGKRRLDCRFPLRWLKSPFQDGTCFSVAVSGFSFNLGRADVL